MIVATPAMKDYFDQISKKVNECYVVGEKARAKGRDPEKTVDIPLAANLSERVEGLVSAAAPQIKGKGIPARIVELEEKYGKLDWRVALDISLEVAQQKFCEFDSKLKAMETGIRIGIAYLTLGVVASPLEGFVELQLRPRKKDGKEYFVLRYSGPIRSAGGTAGAVSVIVADYVRKEMGFAKYDPTEQEIRRTITELYDYHDRVTNLQYLPSEKEVWMLAEHLPVQIDGDPSEKIEVSNYKDLDRIDTNQIRSGMCLVVGECLAQKAQKLWKQLSKWGDDFSLDDWKFLKEFLELQHSVKAKAKSTSEEETGAVSPVYTYIKDLVAGRPVLGHPLYHGGFRLRYGRTRTTGYSCAAIHPATMRVLNKYIGVGTQIKVERPGKAATLTACETIEGPIVKLQDDSVHYLDDEATAKELAPKVKEILYLGDILFNYGDFLNRAHPLVTPGYCEEWWARELEATYADQQLEQASKEQVTQWITHPTTSKPTYTQAKELSLVCSIPLHPAYAYHWNALTTDQLLSLQTWLTQSSFQDGKLVGKVDENKRKLELIGIPHSVATNEFVIIEGDHSLAFKDTLEKPIQPKEGSALDLVMETAPYKLRDKSGVFIGSRMGRPEKAKMRKLTGSPHALFPVGEEGGRMRAVQASLDEGKIKGEFGAAWLTDVEKRYDLKHNKEGDQALYYSVEFQITEYFNKLCKELKIDVPPDLIKGIKGTSNREHIPEDLAKGILRAKHDVHVNKDGTTRYDATQLPITHFRPFEIGTSVDKLKELGYTTDITGTKLFKEDQVLELKPQDIVAPACPESPEEGSDQIMFRVGNFVDDALARMYGLEPYYNFSSPKDVVGHLVMVLAPHTSAAIVGRIIGFSQTQGLFAHPMLHAATRRDCDGDEACISLLLDGLLNFSRQFLPNTRGATQDAPLVLTSQVVPTEVDDMFFDVDVPATYSKAFYDACLESKNPWEVKVEIVNDRINTEQQYEGMLFTHDTPSINAGILCSSYKILPSMQEKLQGQMDLADKIRAVDEVDVAKLVIEKHLIRDIKGNLRKFSTQQFRCVKCNTKYRRPPLSGNCHCKGGRLIFTVSEGSIVKYLEPAMSLAEKYNLPKYVQQSLELTKNRVEGNFGREKEKQEGLGRWFG